MSNRCYICESQATLFQKHNCSTNLLICERCLSMWINTCVTEGQFSVKCPCCRKEKLSEEELLSNISELSEIQQRAIKRMSIVRSLTLEELPVDCPYCTELLIVSTKSAPLRHCGSRECKKLFCIYCKEKFENYPQYKHSCFSERLPIFENEAMSQCPKCKDLFFKSNPGSCPKVRCKNCITDFCFDCSGFWVDKHACTENDRANSNNTRSPRTIERLKKRVPTLRKNPYPLIRDQTLSLTPDFQRIELD